MKQTVILRDGDTWCELLPVEGGDESIRRAVILAGTYGKVGDRVGIPAEFSLDEAGALRSPLKTFLSPFDLHSYELRPGIQRGTLLDDLEDPRRGWNEDLVDLVDESSQEFIQVLEQALAPDGPAHAEINPEHRKAAEAA